MGKTSLLFCFAIALLFSLACSVNVKKQKDGQEKQVDINTLVGGIHVSKNANPEDVGIPVYPGARLREKEDGDNKSANVNISGFGFGLKVVALEYESNDSSDKVIAFYKGQLQKYGNVLLCRTSSLHVNTGGKKWHDDDSHELTCEGDSGSDTELKVGTRENQHIVAVEPTGNGSNFSLVYVRTHGKDADI
jgi:hypothetical protein